MHPILLPINNNFFLPSYGVMIAIGYVITYLYLTRETHNLFKVNKDFVTQLSMIILISAFIGGKIFFYFEDPTYYFSNPANMFKNLNSGFVIYGSLLFAIPSALIFVKKKKIPLLQMADVLSIACCIMQFFGRFGCFLAGCCHGKVYQGPLSVTFNDPKTFARPIGIPLHPTQLYSMFFIFLIFLVLLYFRHKKTFHGQLILIYAALYAIGRSTVEIFRGDLQRGFIIDDIISHSQGISIIVFIFVIIMYFKLKKKGV